MRLSSLRLWDIGLAGADVVVDEGVMWFGACGG